MLVYLIAFAVAILIIPLTGGQFRRLGKIQLRRPWMLFAGLAIQILLDVVDLPRARYDDLGLAILLASYVLIIGFGLSNLLLTGMGVITVGVAMNAFVIAANQGMPYRYPEGAKTETTVKHRPEQPDDILPELGDYIVLGSPFDMSISFGDLVIAVGLVDLSFRASRRPRRSRARSRDARGDDEIDLNPLDPVEEPSDADGSVGRTRSDPFERVEHSRVVDVTGS